MATRFVFFDLGNVLVKFSLQRLLNQVADVLRCDPDDVHLAYFERDGIQERFEKGLITSDEYYDLVCERLGNPISKDRFFNAVNDIFWLNDEIIPFVAHLAKSNFPRGVLSNTGPQHWRHCTGKFPAILELIPHHHILSFEVGEVKPNPKIFQAAINMANKAVSGIKPSEILFIDDLTPNVTGAKSFGIDAVLYIDTPTLTTIFQERKLM